MLISFLSSYQFPILLLFLPTPLIYEGPRVISHSGAAGLRSVLGPAFSATSDHPEKIGMALAHKDIKNIQNEGTCIILVKFLTKCSNAVLSL